MSRGCTTGDDEDDDVRADRVALFGHSIEDQLTLLLVMGLMAGLEQERTRKATTTSPVWLDYDKIFKMVNGKKVTYEAKCFHCAKVYYPLSSGGTVHLTWYRDRCVKRREKAACLSPRFLLILMVVCVMGSTMPRFLILNFVS